MRLGARYEAQMDRLRASGATPKIYRLGEAAVPFDPRLHQRDRRGKFRDMLGRLAKPSLRGRGGDELDVRDTPLFVRRTRAGFVVRDASTGREEVRRTADEAAEEVERRTTEHEQRREHERFMADVEREAAERRARQAERAGRARADEAGERRRREAEFDRKYPRDEQGRRYYFRLESPTQGAETAAQQESSGEVWGRARQNVFAGTTPVVQAYMGRLPEGARGIEFVTDVPPNPGTVPGAGAWSLGSRGPASPGVGGTALRVEGEFAKLRVTVTRNTQG